MDHEMNKGICSKGQTKAKLISGVDALEQRTVNTHSIL
jgi:hypothetical protein